MTQHINSQQDARKGREEELKEEIVKLRAERKRQLKENPKLSDAQIESFLNEERHDNWYFWGNPKTDLLEAELKGIQEGKAEVLKEIKRLMNLIRVLQGRVDALNEEKAKSGDKT